MHQWGTRNDSRQSFEVPQPLARMRLWVAHEGQIVHDRQRRHSEFSNGKVFEGVK